LFTPLDWVALAGYLAIIMAIGLYFSRRNRTFLDYMFGGGRMPWPVIGVSLIATSVSATTFLGNPAETFGHNMAYLMLNIGVFLAIVVIVRVFIPRFREINAESAYEILERRFSRRVRLLAAAFYSAHVTLRTGVLLYGPAIILAQIFGMNIFGAILAMSVLAIAYTAIGGLKAVVWTDFLQFFTLMGGGLLALYFCAQAVGGFGEMASLAAQAGKTEWLRFSLDLGDARTLLSAGLAYTVFEVAIRGCDQQFVQRYMACKDVRSANLSSILSAVLGLLVGLVFYWVGAGLFVYYESAGVQRLPEGTGVNEVFPLFILDVLPAGVTGLLAAAIFAAAMSSLDSAITALSNTAVKDLFPRADDDSALARARFWIVVWGALGALAAFLCVFGRQSLLTKALFFTSLFIGPLLCLFLFAFFRPKTHPKAVFYGAIGGMLCLLPFTRIPVLPADWFQPVFELAWPWNPVVTLTGAALLTLLFDAWPRGSSRRQQGEPRQAEVNPN